MRRSSHQRCALGALVFFGAVSLLLAGVGGQKLKRHSPVMIRSSLLGIRPAPRTTPRTAPAARMPASAAVLHQRIIASAAAFRRVLSYTAEFVRRDRHGTTVETVQFSAPDRFHIEWVHRASVVEFSIVGPDRVYVRATSEWWLRNGLSAAASRKLHAVWVDPGTPASRRLFASQSGLAPATVAHCLTARTGTLRDLGTQSVGEASAMVIADAGDAGSNAVSHLYVASDGPPYPLRLVQTIKRPSHHAPEDPLCAASPMAGLVHMDVRYDNFNEAVDVAPPAYPVDLSRVIKATRGHAVSS